MFVFLAAVIASTNALFQSLLGGGGGGGSSSNSLPDIKQPKIVKIINIDGRSSGHSSGGHGYSSGGHGYSSGGHAPNVNLYITGNNNYII